MNKLDINIRFLAFFVMFLLNCLCIAMNINDANYITAGINFCAAVVCAIGMFRER